MRLDRYQRLAVAAVAAELPDLRQVDHLVVDGLVVRDLAASIRAPEAQVAGWVAKAIDSRAKWLADKADGVAAPPREGEASLVRRIAAWVAGTLAFQAMMRLLAKDPERISTEKRVEIHLKNGLHTEVPVVVEDVGRSLLLQRLSLATELVQSVPGMPVVGLVVPPVASLAAILGAAFFYAAGDGPLGRSLQGMAVKHAALFAANLAPFVGAALPLAAALEDARDIREQTPHPNG